MVLQTTNLPVFCVGAKMSQDAVYNVLTQGGPNYSRLKKSVEV